MGRVLGSPAKLESVVEALPNARQACCAQAPIFWVKLVVFCKKIGACGGQKGQKGPPRGSATRKALRAIA